MNMNGKLAITVQFIYLINDLIVIKYKLTLAVFAVISLTPVHLNIKFPKLSLITNS